MARRALDLRWQLRPSYNASLCAVHVRAGRFGCQVYRRFIRTGNEAIGDQELREMLLSEVL